MIATLLRVDRAGPALRLGRFGPQKMKERIIAVLKEDPSARFEILTPKGGRIEVQNGTACPFGTCVWGYPCMHVEA
jgi:hypothetical protein